MKNNMIFLLATVCLAFCTSAEERTSLAGSTPAVLVSDTIKQLILSPEEWKARLTEIEYHILREKGTERAFTGDLWDNKIAGVYTCAGCDLPLFDSKTKFESGTGWPSYYEPISPSNVKVESDHSLGMVRDEVLCARCGGHLGHVFNDGPRPTGLRYCINSYALNFRKKR